MTEPDDELLPSPLQEALSRAVPADEPIRWTGRPGPRVGDWRDWFFVIFGIEWTALTALFTAGAIAIVINGGMRGDNPLWSPVCFPLFGVPFVLFGIWMITAPARARRRLRDTVYAVTDRRAVVIECGYWGTTVRSFGPEQLAGSSFIERPGSRGDLILSETAHVDSDGVRHVTQVGFLNISDARRVEELIRYLAADAKARVVEEA
jgi:hypothetical protein